MNVHTISGIKAKSLLAASKIVRMVETWIEKKNLPYATTQARAIFQQGIFDLIEIEFSPDPNKVPLFTMSPFNTTVGCAIYRMNDPSKLIAVVPPQFVEMTTISQHHINKAIKEQTERVARIILQSLNAS